MARVLYITYDGLVEPLGQSQIIPYLLKLSDENNIHVISFEKPTDLTSSKIISDLHSYLSDAGINWIPLRYHKRFSIIASIYDIIRGQAIAIKIARKIQVEIIHVRSYIPALIALPLKWLTKGKLLFDIRGFWADERVDGGIWPVNGLIYKNVKRLERRLFRAADHIVTLTEASVPKIKSFGYWEGPLPNISVIPTCADLELFKPPVKPPDFDPFTFGYVGSFGTWYMLDETLALFNAILKLRPEARMIIVNQNEHDVIRESVARSNLPADQIEIIKSYREEVASHIQKMHAASALIRPCFSKVASAPTKLAEYLGCEVPCVGSYDVGDMESILEKDGIGVIIHAFDDDSLLKAAKKIVSLSEKPAVRARCREIALARFSLNNGVESYRSIYTKLISSKENTSFI